MNKDLILNGIHRYLVTLSCAGCDECSYRFKCHNTSGPLIIEIESLGYGKIYEQVELLTGGKVKDISVSTYPTLSGRLI